MKKCVLIIHTGGTIGMAPSDSGYAPRANAMGEAIRAMPEMANERMPEADFVEMEPLLDSTNIAVDEWNRIGKIIADRYDRYDGFVVLHGTDTMAYTASALAFMLRNLGKPVILTGSQIPFCQLRSDARDNLLSSLLLAADSRIREVCLCFGGRLLRGVRSVKLSADELIAFDSPNFPALADCGIDIRVHSQNLLPSPRGEFSFMPFEKHSIAVLKVFPGIHFEIFEHIVTEGLRGIVLEAFGAGNIPMQESSGLLRLLSRSRDCGAAIVVCTQCLRGSARLGLYAVSASLREMGMISGHDLTAEAAVAKLYALLTRGFSGEALRREMETDLCGEMTSPEAFGAGGSPE